MHKVVQNVLAVVAAIVVTAGLSYAVDAILEATGVLPKGSLNASFGVIVLVIAYRTVFNALGGWVAARLAGSHPVGLALGIGIVGGLVSIIVSLSNPDLGPVWYGIVLGILAVPATYVGGRLGAAMRQPAST